MPDEEEPLAVAGVAAAGGHTTNPWARHAREDLQASHILTAPLARWAPEPVEPPLEAQLAPDASATEPEIAIPESVFHARPQHRLPEDVVCRSPICGQVIAVMAVAGQSVIRHEPVLVIEAMKMQNYVGAEVDGILKAVLVSPGDAVKAGQVLFELL